MEKDKIEEDKKNVFIGEFGIIYIMVETTTSEEEVEEIIREVKRLTEGSSERAKILVDMEGFYTGTTRSSLKRKMLAEKCKDLNFHRAAVVVRDLIMKTITSFVIMASGVKNIKIFLNKKEALKWLKEP